MCRGNIAYFKIPQYVRFVAYAAFLCLYRITDLPPGLYRDKAVNGSDARHGLGNLHSATASSPRSRISCSRIRNFCTFLLTIIGDPSTEFFGVAPDHLGCAVARRGSREGWVCEYSPPGNYVRERPY